MTAMIVLSFLLFGSLSLLGEYAEDGDRQNAWAGGDAVFGLFVGAVSGLNHLTNGLADLLWPDGHGKFRIFLCGGCLGCIPWLAFLL